LGLGYEEGRELPHQSAKCATINEGELLYFNKSGIFSTYANHVIIITISATGTTSTTATLTQLLTVENKTTNFKQYYPYITSSLSLAVLLTYNTNIFKINKRADTIMEHTSGPSFQSVRSRMVRIYSMPWLQSTIIRSYYNDVSMVLSLGVKWR